MEEIMTCLALVFKRKGKSVLSEKELVFSVSMDYRWFTPKEAQKLLEIGLKKGLLTKIDGLIKTTFDYKKVEIPINFKPSKKVLEDVKEEPSLFSKILNRITAAGISRREAVARINKIQERLAIDVEVAALAFAKEVGVNIDDLIDETWKEVAERQDVL
ncbi:MAG: DUF2240 family protein [Methanomassiliicoccales archaeon]|jgi:hypothetical protein|nr:DUF2240 family protein [Methanomassiliicoccales archaeon]